MTCVDCGKQFTAEAIPGPYKRCELCKERHHQWLDRFPIKRRRLIKKAFKLAMKDVIPLLGSYVPTPEQEGDGDCSATADK
jgi:hypothetical protein